MATSLEVIHRLLETVPMVETVTGTTGWWEENGRSGMEEEGGSRLLQGQLSGVEAWLTETLPQLKMQASGLVLHGQSLAGRAWLREHQDALVGMVSVGALFESLQAQIVRMSGGPAVAGRRHLFMKWVRVSWRWMILSDRIEELLELRDGLYRQGDIGYMPDSISHRTRTTKP